MRLHTLRLYAFRAHAETQVTFAPGVNLLHGPNGAGKTNILESIHYLCLSKSFITSQDAYALRKKCPFFEIEGLFEGERRRELKIRLAFVPGEGKRVLVNGAPLERMADLVGMVPVVVFSPEDQALTVGGPDERRRFLDNILSQARPVYLDDLLKYRRVLRQRNALLMQRRRGRGTDPSVQASWDAEVVMLGSRVIVTRLRFLDTFRRFLNEAYSRFEAVAEEPSFTYQTIADFTSDADEQTVAEVYRQRLAHVARAEREQGRTLIGPHRDELIFRLDDFEVRRYGSQGQHRTFGMALKLAKYFYLWDHLDERPLLLLDDVFDTLDPHRTRAFVEMLQTEDFGQSLITAAQRTLLEGLIPFDSPIHQSLYVEAGQVHADVPSQL